MNQYSKAISNDMIRLLEDGSALVAATADVAGENVKEARQRLAIALEHAQEIAGRARAKVVQTAQAADETVRANPYQAIAIGAGVGALIGFIVARRCGRD
jgi:ElaB/YqjD/DUF883 family membrane-anchored ribosome-binding protein